jgi:hypothetical protein
MADVLIEFEGRFYDPYEPGHLWRNEWAILAPSHAEERRQIVSEGVILVRGEPASDSRSRFERADILGTYTGLPKSFDPTVRGPKRAYVPGLMNHGTIPMLGGPPKGGKSSFTTQFSAALIVPGRRFLDYFDPAEMTEEERRRDVWLINAEHPADDIHEMVTDTGLEFDNETTDPFFTHPASEAWLYVQHLEEMGGSDTFDLTRQENRDEWEYRFLKAGQGSTPPLTVIVDGVTAILKSDTTRYGEWYHHFKALLKSVGIPNGLAVGHSGLRTGHLMNGVESMAGPDGLWMYDANEPDKDPRTKRYFSVAPRGRGPLVERTRVVLGEDGILRMDRTPPDARPTASEVSSGGRREQMTAKLREAGAVGLMTTEITDRGEDGKANRAELDRMEREGLVVQQKEQKGRVRSIRWWLTTFAPA